MSKRNKIINTEWQKIKDNNPWYCETCGAILFANDSYTCVGDEENEHEEVSFERHITYNEFESIMEEWLVGVEDSSPCEEYEYKALQRPEKGFRAPEIDKEVRQAIEEMGLEIPNEIL